MKIIVTSNLKRDHKRFDITTLSNGSRKATFIDCYLFEIIVQIGW